MLINHRLELAGGEPYQKPTGAGGIALGHFGCLRDSPEEAVADTVIGVKVGTWRPESDCRLTLAWVLGIDPGNGADLGVAIAHLRDSCRLIRMGWDITSQQRVWGRARARRVSTKEWSPYNDRLLPEPPPPEESWLGAMNKADRRAAEVADKGERERLRRLLDKEK